MPTPRQALEAFANTASNPELAQLESLLRRFNLFEAVGVVNHELRHSDFLAFLLDPSQNHGLGALFLSAFLQAVNQTADDIVEFNLINAYVLREWHHIDILVVDDLNCLGVIIENKIGTGEHSDQLNRYHAAFDSHYPGYKVLALYLTPDGDEPSSPDYQAVSYSVVCDVIEETARENGSTLDREIVMALQHYAQLLRRHVLTDSDIAILCRSIYQKHKQALDTIFEHRPDRKTQIRDYVKSLIQRQEGLVLGDAERTWVIFHLEEWEKSPRFKDGSFCVYFEFSNQPNELQLFCTTCQGSQDERQRLIDMALRRSFTGCKSRLTRYTRLSVIDVLRANDYEKPQEEIEALISEKWAAYLRDELPRMAQAIRDEKWLWELP